MDRKKRVKLSNKLFFIAIPCLIFFQILGAQNITNPTVLYWKTLIHEEKEVFLFSYLTQIYDTHTELIKEKGRGELSNWYYENRAELAFTILEELENTDISKFVSWIDEFYTYEESKDHTFHSSLDYAYRYSQMKGETLVEKYESLLNQFKKKKQPLKFED